MICVFIKSKLVNQKFGRPKILLSFICAICFVTFFSIYVIKHVFVSFEHKKSCSNQRTAFFEKISFLFLIYA